MRRHILLCLLAFSAIGATGCVKYNGVPQAEEESPVKITLSMSEMALVVGDGGKTFTADISSEEIDLKDKTMVITNSDKEVVSADAEEIQPGDSVRLKGLKGGSAEITVSSKEEPSGKSVLAVKVSADGVISVSEITTPENTVTVELNETKQIEYTVLPANANVKDVSFEYATNDYFTISEAGLITGKKESPKQAGEYVGTKVTIKSKENTAISKEISVVCAVTKLQAGGFYLLGGAADSDWNMPLPGNKFVLHNDTDGNNEWKLTFNGHTNDTFKVIKYAENKAEWQYFAVDNERADLTNDGSAEAIYDGYGGYNLKLLKDDTFDLYINFSVVSGSGRYKYYIEHSKNA